MMNRFRSPLLIVGVALSLVVCVAVALVVKFSQPRTVDLPVAIDDIEPGTQIDPRLFRLEEVSGLSPESLEAYVAKEDFLARYNGLPAPWRRSTPGPPSSRPSCPTRTTPTWAATARTG
jgi:hypothetical protein